MSDLQSIIDGQLSYYKARAKEYDDWWNRVGRYSEGEEKDKLWNVDIKNAQDIVKSWVSYYCSKDSNVLELACGTGIWTKFLAEEVEVAKLHCVDGSQETIEVLKRKFNNAGIGNKLENIDFEVADIFGSWQPKSGYSVIFFGFFLTHVPPSKLDSFIEKLKKAVGKDKKANIVLIDSYQEYHTSANNEIATAKDYTLREGVRAVDYDATAPDEKFLIYRKLKSGATHPIVKVFYEPEVLKDVFAKHGVVPDAGAIIICIDTTLLLSISLINERYTEKPK